MRRCLVLLSATLVALATALTTAVFSANATLPHTQKIVVRPVHANGTPVAGYTVTNWHIQGGLDCGHGLPSPSSSAVDDNIVYCGPSAAYTMSCWKSRNHTVLCLRDPQKKHLVRVRYAGSIAPTHAPHHPSPQALTLFTGSYCTIRNGGAWPMVNGHPNWFGHYSCSHNGIYGRGDGINRSFNPWTVHVVNNTRNNTPHAIVIRRVRTAYYVGTAS
ncbi:MAG TPA: hypothetical protein VGH43_01710 [Jatrophihabitans sp.]|jgi:hypothetical protein